MNFRKLGSFIQRLLNFPGCILVFISCAGATIGILYLQTPLDMGLQYMPAAATVAYFLCRSLFAFENGLHISGNEILGYIFIASTGFAVAMQFQLGVDAIDVNGVSSLDYTLAMWVFNMFFFFAGASCTRTAYRKSDIIAVALVLLVLIPFLNAPKDGLFLDYYTVRQATGKNITHLLISEWCVFLLLGAFAFASEKLRPFILLITVGILFGLQGRSSTVFTVYTLLVFWVLIGGKKVVFVFGGLTAIIVVIFAVVPVGDMLSSSNDRALERMLLDSDDNSLDGRTTGLKNSLEHLPKSMLYGDPTYIALEAKEMGSYIHNILSMWQFFGLLPFVLILVIIVRGLIAMKKRVNLGNLSVMEEFGCMLLIYSSVSVIFSKSVVFYWIWFSAGYWMLQYTGPNQRRKPKKKRRRRTKKTRSKQKKPQSISSN